MAVLAEKKKKQKVGNATMESYIQFWQNPSSINLTIDQLNQIITMHGFKKVHKRPKIDLIQALSTIDLLLPFRSTLKESISSFASLPLDQVVTDLCSLQWNECSVQSVETVGSVHKQICDAQGEGELFGSSVGNKKETHANWSLKRKRSSRMPRIRRLEKLDALALAALVAAGGTGGGGSSAPAPTASSRASGSDGSC